MTSLIILSAAVMLMMVAIVVSLSQLAPVYALHGENQTQTTPSNQTTYPPVPTCTYDPVIVCTMPPLNPKHAIPCSDNPATPCVPPQNRTSEGVLGIGVNQTIPPIPTCSIPPLNGTLPCDNENKSISTTNGMIPIPQMCPPGSNESMQGCGKQVYWLDNFTGPKQARATGITANATVPFPPFVANVTHHLIHKSGWHPCTESPGVWCKGPYVVNATVLLYKNFTLPMPQNQEGQPPFGPAPPPLQSIP